jgi:hypothetical protein
MASHAFNKVIKMTQKYIFWALFFCERDLFHKTCWSFTKFRSVNPTYCFITEIKAISFYIL